MNTGTRSDERETAAGEKTVNNGVARFCVAPLLALGTLAHPRELLGRSRGQCICVNLQTTRGHTHPSCGTEGPALCRHM